MSYVANESNAVIGGAVFHGRVNRYADTRLTPKRLTHNALQRRSINRLPRPLARCGELQHSGGKRTFAVQRSRLATCNGRPQRPLAEVKTATSLSISRAGMKETGGLSLDKSEIRSGKNRILL